MTSPTLSTSTTQNTFLGKHLQLLLSLAETCVVALKLFKHLLQSKILQKDIEVLRLHLSREITGGRILLLSVWSLNYRTTFTLVVGLQRIRLSADLREVLVGREVH